MICCRLHLHKGVEGFCTGDERGTVVNDACAAASHHASHHVFLVNDGGFVRRGLRVIVCCSHGDVFSLLVE